VVWDGPMPSSLAREAMSNARAPTSPRRGRVAKHHRAPPNQDMRPARPIKQFVSGIAQIVTKTWLSLPDRVFAVTG